MTEGRGSWGEGRVESQLISMNLVSNQISLHHQDCLSAIGSSSFVSLVRVGQVVLGSRRLTVVQRSWVVTLGNERGLGLRRWR